jgi:hypothetical protein
VVTLGLSKEIKSYRKAGSVPTTNTSCTVTGSPNKEGFFDEIRIAEVNLMNNCASQQCAWATASVAAAWRISMFSVAIENK